MLELESTPRVNNSLFKGKCWAQQLLGLRCLGQLSVLIWLIRNSISLGSLSRTFCNVVTLYWRVFMRLDNKVWKVPRPQLMPDDMDVSTLCLTGTGFSSFLLYFTLRALFIYLKEKDIQSKWCILYILQRGFCHLSHHLCILHHQKEDTG